MCNIEDSRQEVLLASELESKGRWGARGVQSAPLPSLQECSSVGARWRVGGVVGTAFVQAGAFPLVGKQGAPKGAAPGPDLGSTTWT